MPDATYPGPSAPALPSVRLTIPDDWSQHPAGEALVRVVGPGADPTSVIEVQVRTVASGTQPDLVLDEERGSILRRPAAVVDPAFAVELCGVDFRGFNASWEAAEGPVTQVFLTGDLGGSPTQVAQLRGEVRGPDAEQDYATVQAILESLVVTPAGVP